MKKGFPAHEHFFGENSDDIEGAVIRGELFELPAGYPALAVPEGDILAVGTANPASDAEMQREERPVRRNLPIPEETVHGERIRLDEPGRSLPMLDDFEGFDPHGESLYRRVLIPAWTGFGEAFPVWAYAMESPSGKPLPAGRWPLSEKQSP